MLFYGCDKDTSLSKHLKCIIKQDQVSVVGKLPEGYTTNLQHNWISPFEQDTAGSVFPKVSALIQATTDTTSKGRLNTFLTWEGSEPRTVTIPLFFEAEKDPEREVQQAVIQLEKMSAPKFARTMESVQSITTDLSFDKQSAKAVADYISSTNITGNQIPKMIAINIGRNLMLKNCVIESVEREDPMIYSQDGLPLQMSVTLVVKTRTTLDTTDILKSIQ